MIVDPVQALANMPSAVKHSMTSVAPLPTVSSLSNPLKNYSLFIEDWGSTQLSLGSSFVFCFSMSTFATVSSISAATSDTSDKSSMLGEFKVPLQQDANSLTGHPNINI